MALLQTALLALLFLLAGTAVLLVVRRAETQAIDAEIVEEVADLTSVYSRAGLSALRLTIDARQRDPSIWEFRVEDAHHVRLAGDLPTLAYPLGWSTLRLVEGDQPGDQSEVVRSLTRTLERSLRLTVGEDLGQRERADNALLGVIASIAAVAAALGLAAGVLAGRQVLRRVDAMALAVEHFGDGELTARVEVPSRAPSDLDQLAGALNRMMDRTTRLMEGMRQISADIAHDLRRPLAHHNQQIAHTLQGPASIATYREALEGAAAEVDEVLRTFQALLHIAELEAGAPGLELQRVDLTEIASRIVQAYGPLAEEGGRYLGLHRRIETLGQLSGSAIAEEGATVFGDSRLLSQMVANLVENALAHTPPGTHVLVKVDAHGPRLTVADDGPGVPEAMRSRIFERFVRLDASRTTAGSGLGLALSAAIAQAFGGRLFAEDAEPGLRIVAEFEQAAR